MTYVERAVAALRAGGVPVKEFPDWRKRAHPGEFTPIGILFHHDASQPGRSDTRDWMWVNGDLSPACHFWVDYDGNWWVGANGLAWHGGTGGGWGVIPANQANQYAFGVETDHTVGEAWPKKQYDSIVAGFALITREFGMNPQNSVCGHKEYAPTRKVDPDGVDLNGFRSQVANWNQAKQEDELTEDDKAWFVHAVREQVVADIRQRDLRLAQIEKRLTGKLDATAAKVDATVASVTALNGQLASVAQDLGARVDTLAADLKPHPEA